MAENNPSSQNGGGGAAETLGWRWWKKTMEECFCCKGNPHLFQISRTIKHPNHSGGAFNAMIYAAAAAKSHQSWLCDPIDGRPPGSCPWDSPGKNTGVGCHFLLQCIKWKVKVRSLSRVGLFETPVDCSLPGSSIHGISQARVLEWTAFAFSTMIYEILVILDSRSTMIDPKEPLNSESPLLCFKQRKIMLYTQKAHGSGPTHPKACSVV